MGGGEERMMEGGRTEWKRERGEGKYIRSHYDFVITRTK